MSDMRDLCRGCDIIDCRCPANTRGISPEETGNEEIEEDIEPQYSPGFISEEAELVKVNFEIKEK
jgi:hypothetical protein